MPRISKDEFNKSAGTDSDVSEYMAQAMNAPLLSHDDEIRLAKRIAEGDTQAREDMIHANLRLVVTIAKKFMGRGVELADLIESGNIGLMRAVKGYDHARGYRFSTYATWWIRQALQKEIQKNGRHFRVPAYMFGYEARIRKVVREHKIATGDTLSIDEIAEKTGLHKKAIRACLGAFGTRPASIHAKGEDGLGFEHTLQGGDADQVDFAIKMEEIHANEDALNSLFEDLSDIERSVIISRFGLFRQEQKTLKQLGDELGVTRERIRQIEEKALQKMQKCIVLRRQCQDFTLD